MIAALLALGAALAPANYIHYVSTQHVGRARDRWLVVTLALGALAMAPHALWLSLMACWFLARWSSTEEHKSLLTWIGIGATWFLLRAIPGQLYALLPWGWLAIACLQVGWLIYYRRPHVDGTRPALVERNRGLSGSPVITAVFLALVSPFAPWWLWPVFAVGLFITFSVHACLAVAIGAAIQYPSSLFVSAPLLGALALVWWWAPVVKGQRLVEWTPRGDSIDGWFSRLLVWRLVLAHMKGHWWLGHGPWTLEADGRRWWTRYRGEVPSGEAHCEPIQHLYEYGLLGVAAAGVFLLPVLSAVRVGEPWSAAFVVGCVLALGHWPLRHPGIGLAWLAIAQGVGR